ncbi:MAG: hypothetical protein GC190_18455 [Alphaproteobacteria bacterium]|nr:hypothetical protein [Alphaproteobacteria bacterium]
MRATYLIAGAVVLALVAAGVLFGTDFFKKNPFSDDSASEAQLLTQLTDLSTSGGYVATFTDGDARKWRLASGHRLERFSLGDQNAVFARLTSSTPMDGQSVDWAKQGLSWMLPLEFNNKANGLKVEIGIVARQSQSNGADSMSVVYATRQAGNSGWRSIPLGPKFALKTFTYTVPKITPGTYSFEPMLAINADPSGSGKSIELLGAYVKIVPQGG